MKAFTLIALKKVSQFIHKNVGWLIIIYTNYQLLSYQI